MAIDSTPAVEFRILDERLRAWGLPRYHSDHAAAIDLRACLDAPLTLYPQAEAVLIDSGIALHMANPHMAAVILPRSGLGHKKGLVLGNATGLIDADYTAEIRISVWNRTPAAGGAPIVIEPGERIAQMMFLPVLRPAFTEVDNFSESSARAGGGFGSTGSR